MEKDYKKIFKDLLKAANETLGLWNKHGLGDDEAESEPAYNNLLNAVREAEKVSDHICYLLG